MLGLGVQADADWVGGVSRYCTQGRGRLLITCTDPTPLCPLFLWMTSNRQPTGPTKWRRQLALALVLAQWPLLGPLTLHCLQRRQLLLLRTR